MEPNNSGGKKNNKTNWLKKRTESFWLVCPREKKWSTPAPKRKRRAIVPLVCGDGAWGGGTEPGKK